MQLIGFLIYLNHIKFGKLILNYLLKKNSVCIFFCKKDTVNPLQSKKTANTTFTKSWLYQYVMSTLSQMLIVLINITFLEGKKQNGQACCSKPMETKLSS